MDKASKAKVTIINDNDFLKVLFNNKTTRLWSHLRLLERRADFRKGEGSRVEEWQYEIYKNQLCRLRLVCKRWAEIWKTPHQVVVELSASIGKNLSLGGIVRT